MSRLIAKAAAVMAAISFGSAAIAQDVTWTLFNNSGATLMEFYTSPVTSNDWGPDLLGSDVVESGGGGTVLIADGSTICDYDMRFVFDDGSELLDTVDICSMASYTLE